MGLREIRRHLQKERQSAIRRFRKQTRLNSMASPGRFFTKQKWAVSGLLNQKSAHFLFSDLRDLIAPAIFRDS
jgi:hypothetical protein